MHLRILASISLLLAGPVGAQTNDQPGIRLGKKVVQKWQFGCEVKAQGGICRGILVTLPVPMDWPEQTVKLVDQKKTRNVTRLRFKKLVGAKQLTVSIPRLGANDSAKVVLTYEITKRWISGPLKTDAFQQAKLTARLRRYLRPSPKIESRDPRIIKAAKRVPFKKTGAWKQVESIYDWVRENVKYKFDKKLQGAITALETGQGDCEELTSLFVAICRVKKIPARSVWIPGHCYPEFYLQDKQGKGHWIPCQSAGARYFGAMPEDRPVLQKGDRFKVPGQRKPHRYLRATLQARQAVQPPKLVWIQRKVEAAGKDKR